MPKYQAPGVYLAEIHTGAKPIAGVSTSTTAFVGLTRRGPFAAAKVPRELSSFAEFEQVYGGLEDLKLPPNANYLAHAARAFFDEGGRRLVVARVKPARPNGNATISDWQNALNSLAKLKSVSIIAAPGTTEQGRLANAIQSRLIAHAEAVKAYRFAVLDIPRGKIPLEASAYRKIFDSKQAAFCYPWVAVSNPLRNRSQSTQLSLPPSGFLCGIYARSDLERGVFKAPANEVVRSAIGLERRVSHAEQETLNPEGVNCLRYFEGRGFRVWGARTASTDPEWKYVNVRRYFLYLEQSIDQGTQWAVFEPNAEPLWAKVRQAVSDFLFNEWRQGGLMGQKPEQAFFVRCDRTIMTQSDINAGRLICQVGVAPIKPAEFVIFRIGQKTARAS
jgi:hypothetical protein